MISLCIHLFFNKLTSPVNLTYSWTDRLFWILQCISMCSFGEYWSVKCTWIKECVIVPVFYFGCSNSDCALILLNFYAHEISCELIYYRIGLFCSFLINIIQEKNANEARRKSVVKLFIKKRNTSSFDTIKKHKYLNTFILMI